MPAPLASVFVICGDDDHAKREKVAAARKHLIGSADPALCLAEYDGDAADLALSTVLDDVGTLPFLAERRVVFVHKADNFITRFREGLEKYLDNPAETGVLVLVAKSFPANTKLFKAVDARGGVRKCERPRGRAAVSEWVRARATALGKRIDPPAVDALLEAVGEEPGLLDSELEKLVLFVAERPSIAAADVEKTTADSRTAAVFELSDALGSGSAAKALAVVHSLFAAEKGAPYMIVGYLAKHLRRLAQARSAMERGADERAVAKAAGYNWVNPAFTAQVRRFDRGRLRRARRKLAEADMILKSQVDSPERVIEEFLLSAAGAV
jgi:DNA polymerase-3 subunit delta